MLHAIAFGSDVRALPMGALLPGAMLALMLTCTACEEENAQAAPLDRAPGSGDMGADGGGDAGTDGGSETTSEYLGALNPEDVHHTGYIGYGSGADGEKNWAIGWYGRPLQAWAPLPREAIVYGLRGGDGSPVYVTQDVEGLRTLIIASLAPGTAAGATPKVQQTKVKTKCDRVAAVRTVPESNTVVYGCGDSEPDNTFDACLGRTCSYFKEDGSPFVVPEGYTLGHIGFDGSMLLVPNGSSPGCDAGTCANAGLTVADSTGTLSAVSGKDIDPGVWAQLLIDAESSQADDVHVSVRALPDGFWWAQMDKDGAWARWKIGLDGKATREGTYKAITQREMGSISFTLGGWCTLDVMGDLYCVGAFVCCDGFTTQAEQILRLTLKKAGVVVLEERDVRGSDEVFEVPRVQLIAGSALVTGP